ncbi:MAG: hypothetical protein K9G38_07080 [Bacteroidales bacterium]|nr:hypothetical protein [Bacteroidales bacterium]
MKYFFHIILIILLFPGCRKSSYMMEQTSVITDLGGGTGTTTWTRNNTYLIDGFVFVNDGQTLTIEPGTVIRAKTGQGSLSSALIVSRGGRIIAEGTSSEPIIFTVDGDDLQGSIPLEARGLWGGLVILGNAPVNTYSGEDMIEGIPVSEPRGVYGGFDEDDNSGILRYVSIRHGGTNIGEGNEINGLTLGGVGRQTTVEYIEIFANEDDGVEIFGGTVNCKNMIVAFCGDDAFDFDQGYNGKCQFLVGISNNSSDRGLECSGGSQPVHLLPNAFPSLYNITLIGDPDNFTVPIIDFYGYGGGYIKNSIFAHPGAGIALNNTGVTGDAYSLFRNGFLTIENNIFSNNNQTHANIYCYHRTGDLFAAENAILTDSLTTWGNKGTDPLNIASGILKLLPDHTVFDDMAAYDNSWYETVTYKGAFGSENWTEGWTLLYESGIL